MAQGKMKANVPVMESGDVLRAAIKARGMMQMDLADRLGVLQSSISGNINRKRMGLEVFGTMLDAMNYDVAVVDRETGEVMWKVALKEDR